MNRQRSWMRPLGLAIGGALATWMLWKMGSTLRLPRRLDRHALDAWLGRSGGTRAAFAIVRAGALLAAVYVCGVGLLATLAQATRIATLSRVAVRLALPALRPLLAPVAAVTITVASALPAAAQARGEPSRPAPVMQVVEPAITAPPLMTLVSTPPPATPFVAAEAATYVVRPGDTFWSIAEHTLRVTGRVDDDAAIAPYWRALIDTNRDRLRAHDEPDLIYPGQVFVLPPVS